MIRLNNVLLKLVLYNGKWNLLGKFFITKKYNGCNTTIPHTFNIQLLYVWIKVMWVSLWYVWTKCVFRLRKESRGYYPLYTYSYNTLYKQRKHIHVWVEHWRGWLFHPECYFIFFCITWVKDMNFRHTFSDFCYPVAIFHIYVDLCILTHFSMRVLCDILYIHIYWQCVCVCVCIKFPNSTHMYSHTFTIWCMWFNVRLIERA